MGVVRQWFSAFDLSTLITQLLSTYQSLALGLVSEMRIRYDSCPQRAHSLMKEL